jgi:hypothetical protein
MHFALLCCVHVVPSSLRAVLSVRVLRVGAGVNVCELVLVHCVVEKCS